MLMLATIFGLKVRSNGEQVVQTNTDTQETTFITSSQTILNVQAPSWEERPHLRQKNASNV